MNVLIVDKISGMATNPARPASGKLYGLDHLRALAIFFVFFYHYAIIGGHQPLGIGRLATFGWTGVDLFFVLSGFLIASQLFSQIRQGKTISLRTFYLKRFFRIIPAYLFTVGLYYWFPPFREREALPSVWRFLTFTQNFGLDLKTKGAFSHAWSLCVEEHFYFFLPLTLLFLQYCLFFKKSYWLLMALFIMGMVLRAYSFKHFYLPRMQDEAEGILWYQYVYYPTYNRLDGLLVGVSIASVYQFLPDYWKKVSAYGNKLIMLGLFILAAAFFCARTSNLSLVQFSVFRSLR